MGSEDKICTEKQITLLTRLTVNGALAVKIDVQSFINKNNYRHQIALKTIVYLQSLDYLRYYYYPLLGYRNYRYYFPSSTVSIGFTELMKLNRDAVR